jgi:hypothetical protein
MRVIYQAYGSLDFRQQALFSALSLLHHDRAHRAHIVVYTDTPEFFAPHGIDTALLDRAFIARGRGRFDFVHRLKLAVLRDAIDRFPDAEGWVVMDADTQWRAAPDRLADALRAGRALMHKAEAPIGPEYHRNIHRALLRVAPQDANAMMQNAGVIGVPVAGGRDALDAAIALTDRLLLHCFRRNWLEQAAVSIVVDRRFQLAYAEAEIWHYWDLNREIGPALTRFFARGGSGATLAKAAAEFDPAPETRALQEDLRRRPVTLRDRIDRLKRSWNKRMIDLRVIVARVSSRGA